MFNEKIRIQRPDFSSGRRILVVSDIHANLEYFKGLLEKLSFCDDDYLIIDGDFLEKGNKNIETLRYIMKLYEKGNVYPLLGNCDSWYHALSMGEKGDAHLHHYFNFRKTGLLYEMVHSLGIVPEKCMNISSYREELAEKYKDEFSFLAGLPYAIETENYIFVHAGIDDSCSLEEQTAESVSAREAFLKEGKSFDKWVIVGHWPVMLYSENIVNANPILLKDRKIISLDGACVLKDDGQLNGLIIPDKDSEEFSWMYYDCFPEKTVLQDQDEGEKSYYIRWGDSEVQVLERGDEFSHCRHTRTGYEMDILSKYLFQDTEITNCNDCSDYILPLKKGDRVGVIEKTSRGYYVKHQGISGWYYGELE